MLVARHMEPMPGTMGLGLGPFVAVWALMMAAMMRPSVTPFASFYTRTFTDHRARRSAKINLEHIAARKRVGPQARRRPWLEPVANLRFRSRSRPSRRGAIVRTRISSALNRGHLETSDRPGGCYRPVRTGIVETKKSSRSGSTP